MMASWDQWYLRIVPAGSMLSWLLAALALGGGSGQAVGGRYVRAKSPGEMQDQKNKGATAVKAVAPLLN